MVCFKPAHATSVDYPTLRVVITPQSQTLMKGFHFFLIGWFRIKLFNCKQIKTFNNCCTCCWKINNFLLHYPGKMAEILFIYFCCKEQKKPKQAQQPRVLSSVIRHLSDLQRKSDSWLSDANISLPQWSLLYFCCVTCCQSNLQSHYLEKHFHFSVGVVRQT